MNNKQPKEQENTPIESPPENLPHGPKPTTDPDLSPNENNPINPQEETPPRNSVTRNSVR